MKAFLRALKTRVIYPIFALAAIMFICVLLKKNDEFRYRNGEVMSETHRILARFTAFVVATATGYIAFKTAKADWELRKRKRMEHSHESK
jgi:hypothetical protein